MDSSSAPTETSHRQGIVQSVHEQALVRPGLSLCLKTGTLAIWRCRSISFPAALTREVGCACCKTPDQLFQRQQSAFESVSAAPDERGTYSTYSKATVQHGNDTCSSGGWDMNGD